MEAINIQMMLNGGYQRNAEVHEAMNDAPSRVAKYDAVVKTSVRECLDGMKHPYASNGHTVWKWGYYPWATSYNESVGHAAYDVLGVWRASTRAAYDLTRDELVPIADTLSYAISLGNNGFAAAVDGSGGPRDYMLGEWLNVGDWNDTAYALEAQADVTSGRYKSDPHLTASILWMKQRLASPSDAGVGGGGDGSTPPPSDAGGNVTGDSGGGPTGVGAGDAAANGAGGAIDSSSPKAGGCSCTVGARAAPVRNAAPFLLVLGFLAVRRLRIRRRPSRLAGGLDGHGT